MHVFSARNPLQPDCPKVSEAPRGKARQRCGNRFAEQILDRREKALKAGLSRHAERLLCLAWEAYDQESDAAL